jgi:branched-chain amino acid transport system permease protein
MAVPLWAPNSYYVNICSQILIWAVFALGLNVLVGYAGLVSLGQSGLFGIACYTAAYFVSVGASQTEAGLAAIALALVTSAIFAVLSLRTTGISFLMITLALGEILWGIAYRWVSVTDGDNGISVNTRPAPFGISLASPTAFYYSTLIIFLVVVVSMYVFVASPFGASLRGTRDQARRMTTLGYNVWLIRFYAFMFSGLIAGIAGLQFFYYEKFVSPYVLSLNTSATVLLMVISGGVATLLGPIVGAALVIIMQYVVSAYIQEWNLVLGAIFVAIILFMPEGLVPGSVRLYQVLRRRGRTSPSTVTNPAEPGT